MYTPIGNNFPQAELNEGKRNNKTNNQCLLAQRVPLSCERVGNLSLC